LVLARIGYKIAYFASQIIVLIEWLLLFSLEKSLEDLKSAKAMQNPVGKEN